MRAAVTCCAAAAAAAGAVAPPRFSGVQLDEQGGTLQVSTFEAISDAGSGARVVARVAATAPAACPTPMCRTSFGKGTHLAGRGPAVFAMGGLMPPTGALVELNATSGAVTKQLAVSSAYLYGIEAVGRPGCEYAAVAVGLSGAGIEDAPAVACVSAAAGGADAVVTLVAQLDKAYFLPMSGTFASHVYDAAADTYHVVVHSRKGEGGAAASASAVASVALAAGRATMSVYSAANCDWRGDAEKGPVNPVVAIGGVDGTGGLIAVVARDYATQAGPHQPGQPAPAVGRRLDLAVARLALSNSDGGAASVEYLFNLSAKAEVPVAPEMGGSLGYMFAHPSAAGVYYTVLLRDEEPQEDKLLLELSVPAGNVTGAWVWDEARDEMRRPYSLYAATA